MVGMPLKPTTLSEKPAALPLAATATFGGLLKFLRRRAQLSQRELGLAVGYSESQISRLERNDRLPDMAAPAWLTDELVTMTERLVRHGLCPADEPEGASL